jgi:TetR/AcrR family transcriptional repressor of nem operon
MTRKKFRGNEVERECPARPWGRKTFDRTIRLVYLFGASVMRSSTKDRILHAAEEIILSKSFHSVGLNEILSAVKVPKGSFYHYFPSKEQFGVELLKHYVEEHTQRLRKFFAEPGTKALEKLSSSWSYVINQVTQGDCGVNCLVAKLSMEVASFSEPMREVLADGLARWRRIYAEVIREGHRDRSIRSEIDAEEGAALIQDFWQGAMQRMQIERSVTPLRQAAGFLRNHLAKR